MKWSRLNLLRITLLVVLAMTLAVPTVFSAEPVLIDKPEKVVGQNDVPDYTPQVPVKVDQWGLSSKAERVTTPQISRTVRSALGGISPIPPAESAANLIWTVELGRYPYYQLPGSLYYTQLLSVRSTLDGVVDLTTFSTNTNESLNSWNFISAYRDHVVIKAEDPYTIGYGQGVNNEVSTTRFELGFKNRPNFAHVGWTIDCMPGLVLETEWSTDNKTQLVVKNVGEESRTALKPTTFFVNFSGENQETKDKKVIPGRTAVFSATFGYVEVYVKKTTGNVYCTNAWWGPPITERIS